MEEIINNNFKITSILGKNMPLQDVTEKLIDKFKGKNVLLWQDMNLYFPTKRLQLCFGVNLIELLKWHINDFNILIINKLKDSVGVQDSQKFIEFISNYPEMKNKQVVLLFSYYGKDRCDPITLEDFPNMKDCIEKFSDNIYSITKINWDKHVIKNLKTQAETIWESYYDGLKSSLRRKKDE